MDKKPKNQLSKSASAEEKLPVKSPKKVAESALKMSLGMQALLISGVIAASIGYFLLLTFSLANGA